MVDNITPQQAWAALIADPQTQLVDVRTEAEWHAIGLPDLGTAGKRALLVQWQFADGRRNPAFETELRQAGAASDQPLLFLCRSGVRSLHAAHAAEAAGFTACANIQDGFEGPPDRHGQRGTVAGWQAEGLPWRP